MPRRARMYVAALPYHLVQRGNNREACFIEPENYQVYLNLKGSEPFPKEINGSELACYEHNHRSPEAK